MKKQFILFILVLCLLATGCEAIKVPNPTETTDPSFAHSEPMPGYDAQNQYLLTTAVSFQETDDFFCGSNLTGHFLHYFDKKSGISGVLCADPACTHDSPACGAYVEAGAALSCYEGKRYWIAAAPQDAGTDLFLWRSDLSGSNQEKVKRLSFEDVLLPYQPQQYVIHRGKLYILGQASVVDGTKTGFRAALLSTTLDGAETFTTIFDETFYSGAQTTARFVGDNVYLSVITFPEGGPFDVSITKYDTRTGASEKIFEETGMTEIPGALWVTAQGDVYLPGNGENGAFVWKLENGKRIETVSWASNSSSVPKILNGAAVYLYKDGNIRYAEIKNLSGEMIYSGKLFPEEISGLNGDPNEYSFMIVGGDTEKIILNLSSFTNGGIVDYTLMLDLCDNLKPTILWSSQS